MPSFTTFCLFVQDLFADKALTARLSAGPGPFAAEAPAPVLAPRFRRRFRRFARARQAMAVKAVAIVVTSLTAAGLLAQWRAAAPVREAPPLASPVWLDISKPLQIYGLAAPQLAREKFAYAARRHSTGGGREDLLTFGEFAGKKWFFRLSAYRHGQEWAAEAPFFVDMARRAAPLGLSLDHATLERAEKTRFGDLETAELTLSENTFARGNCRGFRLVRAEPGLTLAGLACAPGAEPLSAPDLACLVGRLDLLAAGADRPLRDFFGAAQARGTRGCGETARRR
jgi:hypothetical protein